MRKTTPLRWHKEHNCWYYCVPFTIPAIALNAAIQWAIPRLKDKLRSLPNGDKKKDLEHALRRLIEDRAVQQIVTGPRGDGRGDLPLFNARQPKNEPAIISLPSRIV